MLYCQQCKILLSKLLAAVQLLGSKANPLCIIQSFQSSRSAADFDCQSKDGLRGGNGPRMICSFIVFNTLSKRSSALVGGVFFINKIVSTLRKTLKKCQKLLVCCLFTQFLGLAIGIIQL